MTSDLDKISQTGAGHVDCGDMVEIETRSKSPIWRTFGRIQGHVIPKPRVTFHSPYFFVFLLQFGRRLFSE